MKNTHSPWAALLPLGIFLFTTMTPAQEVPATDRRATEIRHVDFTYPAPVYKTKEEWVERAASLRKQILNSAGLWPMPPKTPLNARIFGKLDRGDYTVEKVYFESYPGHYVTGNLYRPKNVTGKVPAVLCPHGHWTYGRLENQPLNAGPMRPANFAKMGFVAFMWDMVGYNDSMAISHTFASHKEGLIRESLWGVNLLGLQLWNSIRSVDFLLSLAEVDPERIGCTGESGGATQTFLLTAVDDRVKVSAPVNMISSIMQGGSLCENAPNLRVDTNNMEIGAMMAPRPMLMVAATGDWTKNTPTVEYPAVRSIYQLFGAEDKVQTVQFDAPHNYNRDSREAVYGWFAHWLQGRKETTPIKEKSVGSLTIPDLLVFYGLARPAGELDEKGLAESLIQARKKQLAEATPRDAAGLEKFREQFGTALRYSLMAEYPKPEEIIDRAEALEDISLDHAAHYVISRRGKGDRVQVTFWNRAVGEVGRSVTLIVGPASAQSVPESLLVGLMKTGQTPIFVSPGRNHTEATDKIKFISTYNRSDAANRVQDILTALVWAKKFFRSSQINLIGIDEGGLWALLARALAPQVDRMIVDASQADNTSDEALLKRLPIPGIRRAGDFTTAVTVAPKTPLLIHNTGNHFRTDAMAKAYSTLGKAEDFQVKSERLGDAAIIEWLKQR
ncbi:MAG TPA: acetylxylan esterase [Blastocatellia bacterium]|nr:acetylxylan esterase [Blastocatellia bacterium]